MIPLPQPNGDLSGLDFTPGATFVLLLGEEKIIDPPGPPVGQMVAMDLNNGTVRLRCLVTGAERPDEAHPHQWKVHFAVSENLDPNAPEVT